MHLEVVKAWPHRLRHFLQHLHKSMKTSCRGLDACCFTYLSMPRSLVGGLQEGLQIRTVRDHKALHGSRLVRTCATLGCDVWDSPEGCSGTPGPGRRALRAEKPEARV